MRHVGPTAAFGALLGGRSCTLQKTLVYSELSVLKLGQARKKVAEEARRKTARDLERRRRGWACFS